MANPLARSEPTRVASAIVHEPIVRRPAHPRRLVRVLVVGRVAAKPQAQVASAPEGSVILSLSLGGVGKPIGAPRPKVTATQGQVQLAYPPVEVRAYKPPPQAAEWLRRCEKNLVVNLDFLASPVIRHRIFQAQPALPRLAHAGFEFHLDLVEWCRPLRYFTD